MKLKFIVLSVLFCLAINKTWADDNSHVGDRVLDKQEVIEMLIPKLKSRSISQSPPTISMEIYFELNSAELTPQARAQLMPVGEALQSNELSQLEFVLEGHTDASGGDHYNMTLSEQRAQSVGEFLYQDFNIDNSRVKLVGKGESLLLDPNNPYSAVNRRVSITTLTQ